MNRKGLGLSFVVVTLATSSVYGAEYIIPPEYDNIKNATHSNKPLLITNKTGHLSKKSYTLDSGHILKIRCADIPKIRCGNGYTPTIHAKIASAPTLREPKTKKLIGSYQTMIQTEDLGDKWAVCGGAIGAVSWDKSTLTQEKDGTINYNYSPLAEQLIYYFFSNASGNAKTKAGVDGGDIKGSDNSYMVIDTQQTCEL